MFIIAQFIGLYVVSFYSPVKIVDGQKVNVSAPALPYGMQPPEIQEEADFYKILPSIIIAFVIAIAILFLLTKFKSEFILRLWFFAVIIIALGIAFKAILPSFKYSGIIIFLFALGLSFQKVYRQNFFVHNITELFIYPGIAAVFVSFLNIWTIIILLILISIYDIWAVWHSGIMQKMAKYQIKKLKVFSGFFVPYAGKKVKAQIAKLKEKNPKALKTKKFRVNVAILGGGDVIFPIIASGVMLKTLGLMPAIFVLIGATLGLGYLFFLAEKKKFYPAMPFITAGIFAGMLLSLLII